MTSKHRKKDDPGTGKIPPACACRTFGLALLFVFLTPPLSSATSYSQIYRTISTINSRPMAMGGAFVAAESDIVALIWNPAGFILYDSEVSHRVSAHLNPVMPIALLYENHENTEDFLSALGATIKAVTYSHRWAEMGLLLWEEPFHKPSAPRDGRFFNAHQALENYMHTLGLRIRLAPTVSLGGTGTLYRIVDAHGDAVLAGAANYGVLLKPAKGLVLGLAYFDFPTPLSELRQEMEGLRDESVNGGVLFHADERTTLAIDLRDVSGDERIGWSRFRFGLERTFGHWLAFRLGYFQAGDHENDVYCFGLGLLGRGRGHPRYDRRRYLANYALLVEEGEERQRLWHLLSLQFCI